MKKIEAIIRPDRLEDVKEALSCYGIRGMTVSQVLGCGAQRGWVGVYRGHEYSMNLLPKIKIEVVLDERCIEEVLRIICNTARTGEVGDGKIFIYPMEKAVRIRTGETDEDAF